MSKRKQKIYWDLDNQALTDSSGVSLRSESQYPYIFYKENPEFEVHLLSDNEGDSSGKYDDLTDSMWFSICIDDDYDHDHDDSSNAGPLCKVTDSDIDQSSITDGVLSFTMNGNTSQLGDVLGTSKEVNNTRLEILGYGSQMTLEFVARIPIICKNIMDPSGGTATPLSIQGANFDWYVDGSGKQCLRILNDDGQVLVDLTP